MKEPFPRGVLGAAGGALGALPLVPIVAGVAKRLFPGIPLPGAERLYGDVKSETYAQALILLVAVPLAAWVFGHAVPRWLESLASPGHLSFEWVGAAFASSYILAQRGMRPKFALIAGLASSLAMAGLILEFRRSSRLRRLFAKRNRRAMLLLALAGAGIDLARRAAGAVPPPGALDDVLIELILSALLLLLVVAVLSLRLSPRPDAAFRRFGEAAWLPSLLVGGALVFPQRSTLLLALSAVSLLVPWLLRAPWSRSSAAARTALLLLLCAGAWRVQHPAVHWLDLFEDGCSLAPAQRYLVGARPYLDVLPVHGWGTDGGLDAVAFRTWGSNLRVFWLRHAIWEVAAFALLAVASFAALGRPFWGALALLFALDVCRVTIERQTLAFAALACLVAAVRTRKSGALFAAGALAGAELMHSLDYGLVVLLGGGIGLLVASVLGSPAGSRVGTAARVELRFWTGAALGALPFLMLLGRLGSLPSFLRASFIDAPRWVDAAWGLPAGDAWKSLLWLRSVDALVKVFSGTAGMRSLFFLALLAAAGAALLLRASAGRFDASDSAACVALAVAAAAMRVVLGRADEPHLERYGLFVGIPAAWLLMRLWDAGPSRRALFVAAAALMLVRLHPIRALESELTLIEAAGRTDRESPGAPAPRSGGALLPAGEAQSLALLTDYMDRRLGPNETFFDFDNQPALYFVTGRESPLRYTTVAQYESLERQREVLEVLEKRKPPVAVLPSGLYGNLDGVPNAERAPEVARYLESHYQRDGEVGGFVVARRRADSP